MVNTFITTTFRQDPDYSITASKLDDSRRRKQILEAKQVINAIEDMTRVSKKLGIQVPKQCTETYWKNVDIDLFLSHGPWLKKVATAYKKCGYEMILKDGKWLWEKKGVFYKIWMNQKYTIRGEFLLLKVALSKKDGNFISKTIPFQNQKVECEKNKYFFYARLPVEKCCIYNKGDRIVSTGFCLHPITCSWAPYLNGLKLYFNAFLATHPSYGNFEPYKIDNVTHPWWRFHHSCRYTFRAALMRKEIAKKEKPWFSTMEEFCRIKNSKYYQHGYIWYNKLDRNQIKNLINGYEGYDYCFEINANQL